MKRGMDELAILRFAPVTPACWPDLEALFGARGAKIVEGYPVEARKGSMPDVFAYTGLPGAFKKAGFVEAARRSPTRPIMRFDVRAK